MRKVWQRVIGLWVVLWCFTAGVEGAVAGDADFASRIDAVLKGSHREAANAARDAYRHPRETLLFFGLRPELTVVEVSPSRGWYTEILAPLLRDHGKLYLASYGPIKAGADDYFAKVQRVLEDKLHAYPELYDKAVLTSMLRPMEEPFAPAGTADLVLTFRNVHNWLSNGNADAVFAAMFKALKPGGTLGVVEHRAKAGTSLEAMQKSGYVTEAYVEELAMRAGFQLVEKSEINANPNDTKDYPEGVWTLPPALRLGDRDKAKYLAIGESDRMTLKFAKPKR